MYTSLFYPGVFATLWQKVWYNESSPEQFLKRKSFCNVGLTVFNQHKNEMRTYKICSSEKSMS